METEQKRLFIRVGGAAALFAAAFLFQGWARAALFLCAFALAGYDVLWHALRNIARGAVMDESFLMSLATLGAIAVGDYAEAAAVMVLYQLGEGFSDMAAGKSRAAIAALMDIRPDRATVVREGVEISVSPEDVLPGETLVVRPGERVPLDGEVLTGHSSLDTAALTGESAPRDIAPGDRVISGCVNLTGALTIKTSGTYAESTVARVLALVEDAGERKAASEKFITRFAKVYTPVVVIAAVCLACVPPLLGANFMDWLTRALTFLVVSCPCALVISVPLSFFCGLGRMSRAGVLCKGANYLEAIAKCETMVFDKTGTLTRGAFAVTAAHPEVVSERELLRFAAAVQRYSNHPISASLRAAGGKDAENADVTDFEELSGRGVRAAVDGARVLAGNARLMEENGVAWKPCHHVGTLVHVAVDGEYAGHIVISDELKPGAQEAIAALRACGVKRCVLLTGDTKQVGEAVGATLAMDETHAGLLPGDKVTHVEDLLARKTGGTLAFVGDGVNDAPVLARADVGVAMGALGADAAIEAADVVLMDDDPRKLAPAIRIARDTLRIARQNIAFSLAVKVVVLALSALGLAGMWAAVVADVGVTMLCVLNAVRAWRK